MGSKKKLALIVGVVVLAGLAGLYFYSQKPPTYKVTIEPTELLPFVSHEQARTNICNTTKGELFDEICQQKFGSVGKNDVEKIDELFLFLKKIGGNDDISDYERLLLSQAVFTALPTKDSRLAQRSGFYEILSSLKNFISKKNIAHAIEPDDNLGMSREEFKKMMEEDLKKVVGNLPKGDNAWTINVMVSRYEWVNGERQPIYSEKYGEVFDPYPGVSIEDKRGWEQRGLVHVRSRVGSYSSNSNSIKGILKEGAGEAIVYSFSIMSWKSKPYGEDSKLILAESGPPAKYSTKSHNFTEDGYKNDDFLLDLLSAVEMPSLEQSDGQEDKPVPPPGTPLPYSEAKFIGGTPGCEAWFHNPSIGLYCFNSIEEVEALIGRSVSEDVESKIGVLDLMESMEPTYPYTDVEEREKKWTECMEQHSYEECSSMSLDF